MKSRLVMVVLAAILGLIAAFGVVLYTQGLRENAEETDQVVKVLVAEEDIPLGARLREITAKILTFWRIILVISGMSKLPLVSDRVAMIFTESPALISPETPLTSSTEIEIAT